MPKMLIPEKDKMYGDWKALGIAERRNKQTYWRCQCTTCGAVHEVAMGNIHSGNSQGCRKCSYKKNRHIKHGATVGRKRDPLYTRWRLLRKKTPMCPEWADDYTIFRDAVSPYQKGTRIVRMTRARPLGPDNWVRKGQLPINELQVAQLKASKGIERRAIIRRLLDAGATLQQLGDILGITRERVRQLKTLNDSRRHEQTRIEKLEARLAKAKHRLAMLELLLEPPGDDQEHAAS